MQQRNLQLRQTDISNGIDCRFRTGFTLVELLVVIAIIGIMTGMMLPAVQQIREVARRCACSNNIAQLGMAVHNYEFSKEHLPSGVINPVGPIRTEEKGQHVSYLVTLLPYVEQSGIANNFDVAVGTYAPANAAARKMVIPNYLCPSSQIDANDQRTAGATCYAGCHHGIESPIDVDNNGTLFLNSSITYGEITDGCSNTILIGEMLPLKNTLGWASGTRASLRNPSELIDAATWQVNNQSPPDKANKVGGFGSSHPGGAQFCLADGSVRLLNRLTDQKVLKNLGDRSDGGMMGKF